VYRARESYAHVSYHTCYGCAVRHTQVEALYEYYTMTWLERQYKEMAPVRPASFAMLDS
jgi:hypothetical protein